MTTRTNGRRADSDDPISGLEGASQTIGARAAAILRTMPGDLDGAGETAADVMRAVTGSVARAEDESVLVGATLAAGMAIGLLLAGGSRLIAAGAVITSVSLGAALMQRRPARHGSRQATTTPAI